MQAGQLLKIGVFHVHVERHPLVDEHAAVGGHVQYHALWDRVSVGADANTIMRSPLVYENNAINHMYSGINVETPNRPFTTTIR